MAWVAQLIQPVDEPVLLVILRGDVVHHEELSAGSEHPIGLLAEPADLREVVGGDPAGDDVKPIVREGNLLGVALDQAQVGDSPLDGQGARLVQHLDRQVDSGHVPGAINLPRGLLEFRIWKLFGYPANVEMNRKIYVQCMTGGRATLATKQLQDIGFTNVIAVIMNFEEWKKMGNPLL